MSRAPWVVSREMFLAGEEVAALLRHVRARARPSDPGAEVRVIADRLIIEALLFSGLRNSEFCRLTLADTVIGVRASVFVVRGVRGEGRTVHVPEPVSELVREYVTKAHVPEPPRTPASFDGRRPLLLNEHGRPYERTSLYRRVVRILTEAGLGARASVQLLRHTYGHLAYVRTGGNLLFVQRQLGHAHPMITAVYAQFAGESYSELAEFVWKEPAPATSRKRLRGVGRVTTGGRR